METAWNFWVSTLPSDKHWESVFFIWLGVTWVLAAGLRRFAPAQCPLIEVRSAPGGRYLTDAHGEQYYEPNTIETHRDDDDCWRKCGPYRYHVAYRSPLLALSVAVFWPIYLWVVLPLGVLCVLFFGSFWFISNVGRRTA